MYKTIVGIEGMACGMCEEHICSTIKKAFEVNKVKVTSFACVEEAPKKGFFAKLFG